MIDLTAITTPFGLLDAETQAALKAHGGPYEAFTDAGWREERVRWQDSWSKMVVRRVKPQPPKPREWWLRVLSATQVLAFNSVEAADKEGGLGFPLVHVREVLE